MAAKVGVDYAVAFPARTGNGALAPGITIGDFTVRLRCLTTGVDAAGGDIPTIVAEGSGDYSAVIGNAFTTAQGAGEYYLRIAVNSTAPRVRDVISFDVEFHLTDFDDLAQPGDAMDLVADAVDAAALATDAVNEIRDSILSDSTPFPGASITEARLAELDPANLPGGVGAIFADTSVMEPLVSANLDATVSSRSDFDETTDPVELLDAGGGAGTSAAELVDDIEADLAANHGAGAWDAVSAITPQAVRDAMLLAPTPGAPAGGSVDEHLDDILADTAAIEPLVTANLDATVSSRESEASAAARAVTNQAEHDATQVLIAALNDLDIADIQAAMTAQGYTTARAIELSDILDHVKNRLEWDFTVSPRRLDLFDRAGTSVIQSWLMTTDGGEDVLTAAGAQTKRGVPF